MLRIALSPWNGTVFHLPGLPSWMARLLSARGIQTEEEARRFLNPSLDQLLPPGALSGLEKARDLLLGAIREGKKIVIYGDYDVDGVSASAILWEALGALGAQRGVYLPDRHREGYGLNSPAVEELAKEYDVLVTVDCGITSVKEVQRAKELGMAVIVTDHHRHGDELPPADAVVTPLLGDYPFPFLCGAGVAWKLAWALLGEEAQKLLELAALATVADLVPLTGENRVIVALGLLQLRHTQRPGLKAVMDRAGVRDAVSSDQVAFQIAPRMNACGRLKTARIALDMLLTRDAGRAQELALQMEALNQERKSLENKVLEEALGQVARMDLVETKAIVVSGQDWNSGVVGLAAGRLAEKYAYPAVALARDGDMYVGSARSAGEIDIHLALSQCADLFERFGGHKQAAGLTLKAENLESFKERLSQAVSRQTGGMPVESVIACDSELTLSQVTEETVELLSRLEPFGMGNPAPRFLVEGAEALSLRAVGVEGRHLKCSFRQDRDLRDGVYFGGGEWAGQTEGRFRLAISPTLNEFRGKVSAECRVYAMQRIWETLPRDEQKAALSLLSFSLGEQAAPLISEEALQDKMAGGQGTLLLCRCLETALRMREKFPRADMCLSRADDPRAYHTVLLYGRAEGILSPFRAVILCDGDAGESEALRVSCPRAEVFALPLSLPFKRLLADSYLPVAALRQCYVALKGRAYPDVYALSQGLRLSLPQACFALSVLRQIQLIDVSLSPFYVKLLPMQKRSPEESRLFGLARQAKEELYGVHGL